MMDFGGIILRGSTPVVIIRMTDFNSPYGAGKTGLSSFTVRQSKNGSSLIDITLDVSIAELGDGFYRLAFNSTHTNTLGQMMLHVKSEAGSTDYVSNNLYQVALLDVYSPTLGIDGIADATTAKNDVATCKSELQNTGHGLSAINTNVICSTDYTRSSIINRIDELKMFIRGRDGRN